MAESLTTEHAYLSVSNFPVVVLTEAGILSDGERTSVMEHLEGLLDEPERQVIVIDVSEGHGVPESQRLYLSDAIQMRSKEIADKWAGLAIVVGAGSDRAIFWQEISPVPVRIFPTLEPAVVWARNTLGLAPTPPSIMPEAIAPRASRVSDTRDRVKAPTEGRASLGGAAGAKAKASGPSGFLGWLFAPRGLMVVGAALVAAVLLFLGPPPEDRLSASDSAAFKKLNSGFALRAYRQPRDGKLVPLKAGDKCVAGDQLSIEMDIPASGYTMVFGAKDGGPLKPLWPTDRAGQMKSGLGLRLPRAYPIEDPTSKETFYVAYCPMRFAASDCSISGSSLACLEGCVTKDLVVEK